MAAFSSGFFLDAGLNGPLKRSERVVFVYNFSGQYLGPRYFRGVNLQNGIRPNQWAYLNNLLGFQFFVAKNSSLPYDDGIPHEQNSNTIQVHMLRPPANAPGHPFLSRPARPFRPRHGRHRELQDRRDTLLRYRRPGRELALRPPRPAFYHVTVTYANPTEDERARNASADYPAWLLPYLSYPGLTGTPAFTSTNSGTAGQANTNLVVIGNSGSATPTTLRIKALADHVTAKLSNNYDRAIAIESYLRSNYVYTLTPPLPKDGSADPIGAFLFDSKEGYCQFFATAMGDMP